MDLVSCVSAADDPNLSNAVSSGMDLVASGWRTGYDVIQRRGTPEELARAIDDALLPNVRFQNPPTQYEHYRIRRRIIEGSPASSSMEYSSDTNERGNDAALSYPTTQRFAARAVSAITSLGAGLVVGGRALGSAVSESFDGLRGKTR